MRQQIGGVLISIGGGVLAVVLFEGTAGLLCALALLVIGVWLVIQPTAPWVLPIATERDQFGRRIFRPQRPRLRQQRRLKRSELRERASALSRKIFEMIGESRRTDPTRRPWWEVPEWAEMSEDQQTVRLHEFGAKSTTHSLELMSRYNLECAAEAIALHDEFQRLGVVEWKERFVFEHPTNPLGLEEIARCLGVSAKKV